MQMGQSKFEMQTMNQSLCDLFQRKMISYEDAIARSSAPDELNELIAGKQLPAEKRGSSTGTHGARPQQSLKTQYRNR
jgi:twitching motility protein PilT